MAGKESDSTPTNAGGAGSGYFQKASDKWNGREMAGPIGGGGMYTKNKNWSFSRSGDGGVAGKGGSIKVSGTSNVEAHNGNRYTDGSSNEEDCLIYIQDGKLLYISTSLGFWDDSNNQYYSNLFEKTINYSTTWNSINGNDHIAELRQESTIEKLNYTINGTKKYVGQGIGSGAGYIEISNGTYIVDESMN